MSEARTTAHVLSNGELSVLVTAAGGGYAALRGQALTAWTPDPTTESQGVVCYIRDRTSGEYWSVARLPCVRAGAVGSSRAGIDRIEQQVSCHGIDARCEIFVAAGVNAEVRRLTVLNTGGTRRSLDLTTFMELVLTAQAVYTAHPAFAKLFVQTAYDAARGALIAWRRPRSPDDRVIWVAQRMISAHAVEFETDRTRFIGRTRSLRDPVALQTTKPLAGTTGTVLDPAFCFRTPLELAARESAQLDLVTYAADSRAELERMLDASRHAKPAAADRDRAIAALQLPERWLAGIRLQEYDERWEGSAQRPPAASPRSADYGGFSDDGAEYVLTVGPAHAPTPQPWINVVANERFGCLVSETGAGYAWSVNSRENRITPWTNDAVSDPHTEALYIRDNDTGACWSGFPGPAPAATVYEVRHGFGYSRFLSEAHGLRSAVCVFVPQRDPIRFIQLELTNRTENTRTVSVISYAQLVLGSGAADTRASIVTAFDPKTGVITATNTERAEYSERVAFARALTNAPAQRLTATASRRSFLGEQGTPAAPRALTHEGLDGRFGTALDPCAALQFDITIEPGQSITCVFALGEAEHAGGAQECIARYRTVDDVAGALAGVTEHWRDLLSRVHARTPARALDLMLNGWLAYQNLACRMLARSAFYQSGGAFGFRDQLQDSSALLYLDPAITRSQILLHAAHQFTEGDVLHWWHPPASKGIRTRFSDDLLWLPYITLFYMDSTGDHDLLDAEAAFMRGPQLDPDDDEILVRPEPSGERGSIYEHCCRAIDRSLTRGAHGLPLMGVGDWNDGMNRVGREGRGESVWLGFFLFDILNGFIPICEQRADQERADGYAAYLKDLAEALNDAGWDGEWYRRAYYDDGTPLGSARNDECRIDALAQAWAVLSRCAPPDRAQSAIAAMKNRLVSEADGIIRLLTPAFDRTPHDPGYIKGYVPGVRENGGQYTHAAIWAVRALAELDQRDEAARLLEMLTPVRHTRSPRHIDIYKGEPYVVAADVYGEPPHVGRAGWTWYTGSAGWLYRVILESILGFTLENGTTIRLRPCIPAAWPGFTLRYRFPGGTSYTFEVEQAGESTSTSDGVVEAGAIIISAEQDGQHHAVRIQLGRDVGPRYQQRLQPVATP